MFTLLNAHHASNNCLDTSRALLELDSLSVCMSTRIGIYIHAIVLFLCAFDSIKHMALKVWPWNRLLYKGQIQSAINVIFKMMDCAIGWYS